MSDHERRYTEGNVVKLLKDFWPLVIAVLGVAVAYGAARNDLAKIPNLETRLTRVEDAQIHAKDDLTEIKQDIKRLLRR